ncbi:hypothetical protein [Pedobacter jamesrossensis]|uniref:Uncharacterized protein n=1 Tax=Pedobacter jamesrossensis TaxID=1908238 RepID=A0ABV8NPQ4_9SPHI
MRIERKIILAVLFLFISATIAQSNVLNLHSEELSINGGIPFSSTSEVIKKIESKNTGIQFIKGKEVNGNEHFYANFKGKGGIQIFSKKNQVLGINIISIMGRSALGKKALPLSINQLLTDLVSVEASAWFNTSLKAFSASTKAKTTITHNEKLAVVTLSYDDSNKALTILLKPH